MSNNMHINNNDQNDSLSSSSESILSPLLKQVMTDGIYVDKNLRQPTYYSVITFKELKVECFSIIVDILTSQKIPIWLCQRISWYFVDNFFQVIVNDLTVDLGEHIEDEEKIFVREKLVIYLRKSIPNILKEWFNERSKLIEDKKRLDLILSFERSEDDKIRYLKSNEFGIKNKRRVMEDKTCLIENSNIFSTTSLESLDKMVKRSDALYAVFDGHCGVDCAQYVSTHLAMSIILNSKLKSSKDSYDSINQLIFDSFQNINQQFTDKASKESMKSGSTCCLCLLYNNEPDKYIFTDLLVAWCGDTQFCLVKNGKINYFSRPHKPEHEKERSRIENCGAFVSFINNSWRINGSLGVARSFGDIEYQTDGVVCDPDIKNIKLDGTEDYLIIGCDGLWECLEIDDLCSFVYENRNSETSLSELLVRKAKENGSSDNITAIFVLLKDDFDQISLPSS